MTKLDKVIVGITSILLIVLSIFLALTAFGNPVLLTWIQDFQTVSSVDGIVVILIVAFIAIYLALMIWKTEPQHTMICHTEHGQVHISLNSIKELIIEVTSRIQGIKNVSVTFFNNEPLDVKLDLELMPDHNIPALSESVQATVKDYLAETVGITVANIQVFVKGIHKQEKDRSINKGGM